MIAFRSNKKKELSTVGIFFFIDFSQSNKSVNKWTVTELFYRVTPLWYYQTYLKKQQQQSLKGCLVLTRNIISTFFEQWII